MSDHHLIHLTNPEAGADAPASCIVYPVPRPESGMGTLGAFALGMVTGIVGVAVTAVIMDKLESGNESNGNADSDVPDSTKNS